MNTKLSILAVSLLLGACATTPESYTWHLTADDNAKREYFERKCAVERGIARGTAAMRDCIGYASDMSAAEASERASIAAARAMQAYSAQQAASYRAQQAAQQAARPINCTTSVYAGVATTSCN